MSVPQVPRSQRNAQRAARRRRRIRTVLGIGALAALAGGLGAYAVTRSSDESTVATTCPSTTTSSTIPPTTTTLRDPRRGNGQPVTFAFGGDSHFEGALRTKLDADPNTVLAAIAPTLSSADLAMVNLETAITEGGTKVVPKEFNFRAPGTALDVLRAAGVDVTTIANNHGVDYGLDGLADSQAQAVARQFPLIGMGANATEAYTPYRVDIKGQRIAVFAATDVMGEENVATWTATDAKAGLASTKYESQARMVAAIQTWRPQVDTIAVMLHWGVERQGCATPRQQELAAALVAAGADIIVGSHAHVLEGAGRLGTAFVGYGLGNFIWYNESGENGRTGVLFVTATGRDIDSYRWVPARIRGGVATPYPPGPEADAELAHWNDLRACTGLAP